MIAVRLLEMFDYLGTWVADFVDYWWDFMVFWLSIINIGFLMSFLRPRIFKSFKIPQKTHLKKISLNIDVIDHAHILLSAINTAVIDRLYPT